MPIVANPSSSFYNPGWGEATKNLGTALFGDPELNLKRDLYSAQTKSAAMEARKNAAIAAIDEARGRGQQELYNSFDAAGNDPAKLSQLYTSVPYLRGLTGFAKDAGDVASATARTNATGQSLLGTQEGGLTSLNLQGVPTTAETATTPFAQQVINSWKQNQAFGVADRAAQGTRDSARIGAGEKWNEFVNQNITNKPGDVTRISPAVAKAQGLPSIVYGRTTPEVDAGAAMERISAGRALPTDQATVDNYRKGSGEPRMITGEMLGQAQAIALGRLGVVNNADPSKPDYIEGALSQIPPENLARAQKAANDAIAKYNSIEAGADAFQKALGLGQWNDRHWYNPIYNDGYDQLPKAAPPPIVPKEQRVKGKKYQGANGLWGVWNGYGFVPSTAPSSAAEMGEVVY